MNLAKAPRTPPLYQARLTWDHLGQVTGGDLPVIVKGIAHPEDADLAVEHGAAAVYVSNHGGRQLDHTFATLDLLQDVAGTVAGRVPVFLDGGITRGTDVLKALGFSASAVGIGRLYACALAAGGEQGVIRCLELLAEELAVATALSGLTRPTDASTDLVRPSPTPTVPHDPFGESRP